MIIGSNANPNFWHQPNANSSTAGKFQMPSSQQSMAFRMQTAPIGVDQGSLRDNILSNISQARVTASSSFNTAPAGAVRESFSIQDHYTLPPEDVAAILSQLEYEIHRADYSGMTTKQAYEWIENKFVDAFGKDFMIGFNLLQIVPGSDVSNDPDKVSSNYEYVNIGRTFNDLVSGSIGFGEMQKITRERLYGNKSDIEIVDAIIAKHPERLTNRCLALITSEMYSVGIHDDIGFFDYVSMLFEKAGGGSMSEWTDFEKVWNSLLDRPANVQQMAFPHNKAIEDDGKNPYVQRVVDILVKLGAKLGPNGYFLDPDGDPFVELDVEYGSLDSDDLFDEFFNDLEKHDEDLRESKEQLDKNNDLNAYEDVGVHGEAGILN